MTSMRPYLLGVLLLSPLALVASAAPKSTFTSSGKVTFCPPKPGKGCPAGDDTDYIVLNGAFPCKTHCGSGAYDMYIHYPTDEAAGFPKSGKMVYREYMLRFGSTELPSEVFYHDASNALTSVFNGTQPLITITRTAGGTATYTMTAPRSILR